MIGLVVKLLTGGLLDKVLGLYDKYAAGQITKAELDADVAKARIEAETAAQAEFSKMATSIAESTQATIRSSPVMQRAVVGILFLQTVVLFWHQIGAGAYYEITGRVWPSPGISLEWAYLLVASGLGMAAFVFRK